MTPAATMPATQPPPPHPPHPVIVAVVGGSASGKSTLARHLAQALHPAATTLSLDAFYRCAGHLPPARRNRLNFDHPRRIDWPLLASVLDATLAGLTASVPRYSFEQHARESTPRPLHPAPFLVLEGLWLLRRRDIRSRCAYRIFLDCPHAERLRRRLRRDLAERGRSRTQILHQWRTQSEPGFHRFVAPQRRLADTVVRSPVSPRHLDRLVQTIQSLPGATP